MYKKIIKNSYIQVFCISFIFSFLAISFTMILNNGKFLYYGDFTAQQISFAMTVSEQIKSGNGLWSWYTELGADISTSYNFYILYSPFFWILCLFPVKMIPYLIGPLYAIKVGFMGLTSFILLKSWSLKEKTAKYGAILYSLSGFQFISMFFNHFAEPIIIFPLLLYSFDRAYKERKYFLFALMVFVSLMINYYFFFGQVVFISLYFFIRYISDKEYRRPFRNILVTFLFAVLGIMMAMINLLPTVDYLTNFGRTNSYIKKWFIYKDFKYYLEIFKSFFMFPTFTGYQGFFDIDAKWSTISLYIPVISSTFMFSFVFTKQLKYLWTKILIIVCTICSFVPILNGAFQFFNTQYYARWFYMFTLIIIFSSCLVYENFDKYKNKVNYFNLLSVIVSFALFCISIYYFYILGNRNTKYNETYMYMSFFISMLNFLVIYFIFIKKMKRYKLENVFILLLVLQSCFYGCASLPFEHRIIQNIVIENRVDLIKTFDNKNEFYRYEVSPDDYSNIGLMYNVPSDGIFLSSVSSGSEKFYSIIDKRLVNSGISIEYQGFHALLSNKYLLIGDEYLKQLEKSNKEKEQIIYNIISTKFKEINSVDNGFHIFENPYYIKFGFCFDNYILKNEFNKYTTEEKDMILLEAIVIDEKDENIVSQYIEKWNGVIETKDKNVNKLNENSVNNLIIQGDKFSCDIITKEDTILFFSIPYTDKWNIYVDNIKVNTIEAFYGLTAIPLTSGHHIISAEYNNKYFEYGAMISFASIIIYFVLFFIENRKEKTYNL